jgi:hypothetical protein
MNKRFENKVEVITGASKGNDIASKQGISPSGFIGFCLEVLLLTGNSRCKSEQY